MDKQWQKTDEENLRKRILEIYKDPSISPEEKSRQTQELMTAGFKKSLPDAPADDHQSSYDSAALSENDKMATYQDDTLRIMGCKHYKRGNRLQANCCNRWFTCRFCHDDEVLDHQIVRQNTKNMLCMYCKTPQPAAQRCAVPTCGMIMARYYCDRCKLWDDDMQKNIYHCDDCGICRVGKGLGVDYFHCKTCNVCMMISLKDNHRCIERNLESDCPICGEFMFTSTSTVIFMPCGHCIHDKCHSEYIATPSYQCPTCLKSLFDMTDHFARIDSVMAREPMPPEYEHYVSNILCNDCERRSQCRYHFIYNKCSHCGSYNTAVLTTVRRTTGGDAPPLPSNDGIARMEGNAAMLRSGQDEDNEVAATSITPPGEANRNRSNSLAWANIFSSFSGGEGSR